MGGRSRKRDDRSWNLDETHAEGKDPTRGTYLERIARESLAPLVADGAALKLVLAAFFEANPLLWHKRADLTRLVLAEVRLCKRRVRTGGVEDGSWDAS